jgi:site-specific DNA recombinase
MLGIYCRISKEGDSKRSIETQKSMGIAFADENKLKYKVYIDSGISGGKNRDSRPELDNLFNDVEDGLITSIYVYNQDRLARDEVTWFQLAAVVLEYDVKLYENGVLENLKDSGTFTMRGIKAIFDADERRKTSKRFKDVLRRNAEKGRRFSLIQYGYKEGEDKRLVINEEEASIVRRMYQMSLEGKGVSKIAEILNAEGIKTRYNEMDGTYKVVNKFTGEIQIRNKSEVVWKGGTINNILKNPIYKGERLWGKETYPAPPIFDEWYWQKVNDNFKNNSNNKGQAVKHSYLLKGLLRCGKCGSNYYGRTRVAVGNKKPKDHYYMCSSKRRGERNCGNRSISIDALDTLIWFHLIYGGRMQEIIELNLNNTETNKRFRMLQKEQSILLSKYKSLINRKEKITEAIGLEIITLDEAKNQLDKIRFEMLQIENDISINKKLINEVAEFKEKGKESISHLKHLRGISNDRRKEIIKMFIKNIEIKTDNSGCLIDIQFVDFGIKNEEYFIERNNRNAHNFPSNPILNYKGGQRVFIDLKEWSELFKKEYNSK